MEDNEEQEDVLHNDPLIAMQVAMDEYLLACQKQELAFERYDIDDAGFRALSQKSCESARSVALAVGIKTRKIVAATESPVIACMRRIHDTLNQLKKFTRHQLSTLCNARLDVVSRAVCCLPGVHTKNMVVDGKLQKVLWRTEKCQFVYDPNITTTKSDKAYGTHQQIIMDMAQHGPVTVEAAMKVTGLNKSKTKRVLLSLREDIEALATS